MKAFTRVSPMSQEVELRDMPIPQISPDEVLVHVKAFGVGIHDRYFIPQNASFPYTIGSEGAGIIIETGANATRFRAGDRVVFTTILQPQGGTWAEQAVARQEVLVPIPENMEFAEAAALPIAGGTAIECMKALNLSEGDRLFIAGASGAIGTLVIQMAKKAGARIAASSSSRNHDYMKQLGVEMAVDYNDPGWTEKVKEWSDGGVDAALAIQPGTGSESIKAVREGGRLITVSGDAHTVAPERNISIQQMGHSADATSRLKNLVDDVAAGRIRLVIEHEFPFEEALKALEKTETRHARGKLVVKL